MDFTREPIIETIITPKEGYKLVVRNSKNSGQEEYLVDAVEIIAFGHALFFRSLEKPKAFLAPVSDYEVLEVREARMVLKSAGVDRSIKIGGGREGALKASREVEKETVAEERVSERADEQQASEVPGEGRPEVRVDKKRDRRRHYRKRKGRDEQEEVKEGAPEAGVSVNEGEKAEIPAAEQGIEGAPIVTPTLFSALLQPPPTLISETISRYRQNELFKGAFYLTEDEQYKPHDKVQELLNEDDQDEALPALQEPDFVPEESVSESQEEGFEPGQEESIREFEEQPISFEEGDEQEAGLPLYAEEEAVISSENDSFENEANPMGEHSIPHDESNP